jgi:hypothetical protein
LRTISGESEITLRGGFEKTALTLGDFLVLKTRTKGVRSKLWQKKPKDLSLSQRL